jgi:hypothetical protein
MARLEDAGVDTAAHVFDEGAEHAAIEIGNGKVGVDDEASGRHGFLLSRLVVFMKIAGR